MSNGINRDIYAESERDIRNAIEVGKMFRGVFDGLLGDTRPIDTESTCEWCKGEGEYAQQTSEDDYEMVKCLCTDTEEDNAKQV